MVCFPVMFLFDGIPSHYIYISDCSDPTAKCKCIQRIIMVLKFYQMINENDNINDEHSELILEYFEGYKHLINDYHHITVKHLNSSTASKNNHKFRLIDQEIGKYIKCNVNKCKQYIRYSRNRENIDETTKHIKDENVLFYIDLLDNIHCHFLHSYHVGFRSKFTMTNNADIKPKQLYYDKEMEQLKSSLNNKRQHLVTVRGLNRISNNKFLTKIHSNDKQIAISCNDHENKQHENVHIEKPLINAIGPNQYNFGNRYSYWDFYKNRKYSNAWYVDRKYLNLKDELINNNIFKIDIIKYCHTFIKAQKFINNSDILKSMKSKDYLKYDIGMGILLKMENIMAIIFYTDYDQLSYQFSKTFRKLTSSDTINTMKLRNREFYHWSKILRETVECYGTEIWKSNTKIFYHGVSMVYFNSFVANFNCPTSTTSQIEVAAIFADENGVILELEQYAGFGGYNLKYFDCSLLSVYGNEG